MKNFKTLCVHPIDEKNNDRAVTAPILTSTAYNYLEDDHLRYPGFYSTYNQERLGKIISNLEGGSWGIVFSSGMAAISTGILSLVSSKEHIIFSRDLYGGTWKFVEQELPKRNIDFSYAHNTLEDFEAQIRPETKLIYLETPSNPLLSIIPLQEIAALARKHGILTMVDNTFASPINQRPLSLGIDLVLHSGTKYLGGHNDLPYGALTSIRSDLEESVISIARMYGGSLSPYECYQAERSLKTLAIRIQRQNSNAFKIAEYLIRNTYVDQVYYPGLPSHPGHRIAMAQMTGFGGMLSFELSMEKQRIHKFLQSLSLIRPALSLGGVESLICSPAETSHRAMLSEERLKLGIKDNLLRLSVGIEDQNDLIADLKSAIMLAVNQ
ncbi:aminotransferase class I/II-fold pyridoxal phosphate-dependent enzyme [Olivibacter sp. CPCC 100613]|uniref:trans-sulfuration enzyme family protein n=1 Tax=Olivibacter sp. CPCC 100613 TaxID=3079931 RepID=UPI002FF78AC2